MKDNEYRCAVCQQVYDKGVSDEEAKAEAEQLWTEEELEDTELVCDDCFNEIIGVPLADAIMEMNK